MSKFFLGYSISRHFLLEIFFQMPRSDTDRYYVDCNRTLFRIKLTERVEKIRNFFYTAGDHFDVLTIRPILLYLFLNAFLRSSHCLVYDVIKLQKKKLQKKIATVMSKWLKLTLIVSTNTHPSPMGDVIPDISNYHD